MSAVHTEFVRPAHEYTRSPLPWKIADRRAPRGMRDFGPDVKEAERERRRSGFLRFAVFFLTLWALLLIF